jgi:two-component system cell cycle response regulator
MKILIAEDDLTSRTILEAVLKKWGYQPVVVSDGNAAWEMLQSQDAPSLVVLDWRMPGMDGLEVCRRVRDRSNANPPYIILLTVRGDKADIVEGLEAGANDYVSKPYDNDELRARIRVGQRVVEVQSELNNARNALLHEAMHDSLTGVFNRRAILEALKYEIARSKRSEAPFSVGIIDLDHFKQVNDTYGHQIGDEVLGAVVKCLQSNLREYDSIGRYGGEEFLIVAPGSNGTKTEGLYDRLCNNIALSPVFTSSGLVVISVSIGVAGGTGQVISDSIIAAADSALYCAKADGRNRVVYSGQESKGAELG